MNNNEIKTGIMWCALIGMMIEFVIIVGYVNLWW